MTKKKVTKRAVKKSKVMGKPTTVAEYIADTPKEAQAKLKQMRACIKSAAPGAEESLKWGALAVSYKRILVIYAAHKNHIGFYPTPKVLKAFAKELTKFESGKGSVKFPLDEPLPLALIRKMTKYRVKDSIENDGKWM